MPRSVSITTPGIQTSLDWCTREACIPLRSLRPNSGLLTLVNTPQVSNLSDTVPDSWLRVMLKMRSSWNMPATSGRGPLHVNGAGAAPPLPTPHPEDTTLAAAQPRCSIGRFRVSHKDPSAPSYCVRGMCVGRGVGVT